MAAVTRLVEPRVQRRPVFLNKFRDAPPQPVGDAIAGNDRKTFGKPGEAQLVVRFPDPIGGGFCDIAKTPLTGGQREPVLLQQKGVFIIEPRFIERVARSDACYQHGKAHQENQQRQDHDDKIVPRILAAPDHRNLAIAERQPQRDLTVARRRFTRLTYVQLLNAVLMAHLRKLRAGQHIDENQQRRRARCGRDIFISAAAYPGSAHQRGFAMIFHRRDDGGTVGGVQRGAQAVQHGSASPVFHLLVTEFAIHDAVAGHIAAINDKNAVIAEHVIQRRPKVSTIPGPGDIQRLMQIHPGFAPV
ncbi:hypothetical protein BN130_4143 [Cronobacter malonaticus 507]|nr:hypothetical protein BN130_4143 [Cronobacter malonaticus 507]